MSWDQVSDSLEQTPIKLAEEEIEALGKDESFIIFQILRNKKK